MDVANVKLYLATGDASGEVVLAPDQHVYIDVDPTAPGVLRHLRSDSTGNLMPDPSAPSGTAGKGAAKTPTPTVTLDDTRTYSVVVAPAALTPVPGVGTSIKLNAGRLVVPAHIAIKITTDGTKPSAGLACDLTVGSTTRTVRSTATGWILSSDHSDGEVKLVASGKWLAATGSTAANVSLAVSPAKPVRGDKVKIAITVPSAATAFKVTEWRYDISHQNPGSSTPVTAQVTRPAAEAKTTFDSAWEGILCASGMVKVKCAGGVILRSSGDKPVSAQLTVQNSGEASLSITVAPRTGTAWESTLVEKAEQPLNKAISTFHDTGRHQWDPSGFKAETTAIGEGPNRGCTFLKNASLTLTSTPSINSLVSDASSAFSQAQDKAYLTSPPPVRPIPRNLYTVGQGGAITIKNNDDFAKWILGRDLKPNESLNWVTSAHCITPAALLAGTQRHEYKDADKSHKQNCLKARRALDPLKFGESLVQIPGTLIQFNNVLQGRANAIVSAAPTHDVVDEDETRKAGALKFKAGANILGVNVDNNGAVIGPVWNPTTQRELAN